MGYNFKDFTPDELDRFKRMCDRMLRSTQASGNARALKVFEHAALMLYEHNNPHYLTALMNMSSWPVTIDEFIESKDFLGHDPDFNVWPSLRDDLRGMNPDIWTGQTHIFETFDGGATSTGKTHKAHITQLYQLYTLCCFPKPVKLWPRLSSNTPLLFFFQSVQERITKRVIYEPFRNMFTQLPYVRRHVTWDKDKETVLELGNGVQVIPALASLNNIVGQAIVSGILDEVNFMSVVEESKQVVGARGQGGLFDQAQIVYNNITRRRKSRFITKGPSPGIISVLSSVRYLGDFMDRRLQQYEAVRDTADEEIHTFVMRRAQYQAHPPDDYSGVNFRLLVGSTEYGTRVLKDEEVAGRHYPLNARVEEVPVEYKQDFLRDPEGALRDVCGIATDVISPYITQRHKIIAAITRGKNRGMKPWVLDADIDLANSEEGVSMMPQIIEENLPKDRGTPRYVHVDLSISGDRCGIAIVKVSGYKQVTNVDHVIEHLPHYVLEQGITIKPNTAHELDIAEVRRWIMSLKSYYGINIAVVTYDGFQSRESMQLLRKAGVPSMHVSVDSTMDAYDTLKVALYQDRIDFQDHELLKVELSNLEYNAKKKKVDHNPKGCFSGDTEILLADGGVVKIKDMVGKTLDIMTFNGEGFTPAPAINPRITKNTDDLIQLEFADGSVVTCTPDHRFMREDGSWVEAQDIAENDDIKTID